MHNRETWLAAAMVELADTADARFDEAAYARRLAGQLAELLAPAEVGLLVADGSGHLLPRTASTARAAELWSLEARHAEGPCTNCYRTGEPVLNEPLGHLAAAGRRYPRFAAAARAAGFRIVSALPMGRRGGVTGAVGILDAGGHPLTGTDASLARALADVAASAILHHRAFRHSIETSRQLQHALDSRVRIEQAKGAIAARLGVSPEVAFELLRGYARRHNQMLGGVADATIRGDLPVRDLVAGRQAGAGRAAPRQPAQSWRTSSISRTTPSPSP
ncbi:MAG TPA: GAF and ANTAR domain-containing protein [Streptosporangiaceae bacterium]|nr:GAF and ANTAR domain-containing protein [Streptosporangiaceae bacterium]